MSEPTDEAYSAAYAAEVAALAEALDQHAEDFTDQPESFEGHAAVAANLIKRLSQRGWRLTPATPSAEARRFHEEGERQLAACFDRLAAAEMRAEALREALSKHPPSKLADYERCGYCGQHWPCAAVALLAESAQ